MVLMVKKYAENVTTLVFQVNATMSKLINVMLAMEANSDSLIQGEERIDADA